MYLGYAWSILVHFKIFLNQTKKNVLKNFKTELSQKKYYLVWFEP